MDKNYTESFVLDHKNLLDKKKESLPKKTMIINAFGGAGAGKTTACLGIAEELKKKGYVTEYVQEYAKELVWDAKWDMLDGSEKSQFEILKEQITRIDRLYGKVDFIVTDAPILLNQIYNKELTTEYEKMLKNLNSHYRSFNFFVKRDEKNFEKLGRIHSLEESKKIDKEIKDMLSSKNLFYGIYTHKTLDKIVKGIEDNYKNYITTRDIESVSNDPIERLSHITKDTNVSDIVENLKEGIKNVFSSGQYQNYLNYMSSFYNYSINNCLLIFFQKPDATLIGSYGFWQQKNRFVKKGEHGIKILAPVTEKRVIKVPLVDSDGSPMLGDNNTPLTKTETATVITGFKLTTVFDVSQTKGEPVPNLLSQLKGNSKEAKILISVIKQISEYPIKFNDDIGRANGYFANNEIIIKSGMSTDQIAKTLIHEYTHSILHNDIMDYAINRSKYEIEAESAAYVVSKHYGLDTSSYSFGYITGWTEGKDIEEFKSSLELVKKVSEKIITKIDLFLEKEYALFQENQKIRIIKNLKKHDVVPSPNLVKNILKLNELTKKENTINCIKKLTHSNDQNDLKNILEKINKELMKMEKQFIALPEA